MSTNRGISEGISKRDKWIVRTVAVVILVVVLVSVFVYMVQIWPRPHIPDYPSIRFADPEFLSGNEWEVEITHVTEAKNRSLSDFRAILFRNGTTEAGMNPLVSGNSDEITFIDSGSQGNLNAGDSFILTCKPGSHYELAVVHRSTGNSIGSGEWWA